jgi:hypothetical protein
LEFMTGMSDDYVVVGSDRSELTISARTFPSQPTVRLLAPFRQPYETEYD